MQFDDDDYVNAAIACVALSKLRVRFPRESEEDAVLGKAFAICEHVCQQVRAEQLIVPKFALGSIVITQGALESIAADEVAGLLRRHVKGDWGDLSARDKRANDLALTWGERVLSAYETTGGPIWILTEWDRSSTTIMTPDEY